MQQSNRFINIGFLILLASTGCSTKEMSDSASQPGSGTLVIPAQDQEPVKPSSPTLGRIYENDWFESIADDWNCTFSYTSGEDAEKNTILETVGGGVALFDYDLDGCLDLLCVGGGTIDPKTGTPLGTPCGLFRNIDTIRFHNVSTTSWVDGSTDYSHGCVCGDLNSDGFDEIVITCYGSSRLLINQGDGTFTDSVALDEFSSGRWNTAASLGDVNRDGEVDIYFTGYLDWIPSTESNNAVPGPQTYNAISDLLLLNLADTSFADISRDAGIRKDGMGLGVVATDINQDNNIDFYVANDVNANHLYIGGSDTRFHETGESAGVAYNEVGASEGSMGVDCVDINGDGHEDIWVTNFEMEDGSLYLGLGEGQFQHATTAYRLSGIGRRHVGFGTGLRDFNNDGWPDLFVVNGHVRYKNGVEPFLQTPILCANNSGNGFSEISENGGSWFRRPHAARGAATGDIDNDGDLDIAVSNLSEPVSLLLNRDKPDNWIKLKLIGTRSSRSPIGCRIQLNSFGRTVARTIASGAGYMSHSESAMLFPLEPARTSVDVRVFWPSGFNETYTALPIRIMHVLTEGSGHPLNHSER